MHTAQFWGNVSARVGRLFPQLFRIHEASPFRLPIIGAIDRPPGFVLAQAPMTIAGWAVAASEINKIDLFVGEANVGTAIIGLPRPAIARARPQYQFAGTAGFESLVRINIPTASDSVRIRALVNTVDGQQQEIARSVRVFASAAAALEYWDGQWRHRNDSYVELASLLIDAHDLKQAELAVEAMCKRCPDHPGRYVQQSRLLILQNRNDEADALLAAGAERFPNNPALLANYARAASRRRNWQTALSRWRAVRKRFPDYAGLDYEEGRAQLGVATDAALAAGAAPAASEAATAASARNPHAALMLHFENLGANCEFGLVQRHFGSEPLGLLRFANTRLESLLKALENRFEGVGHPDNTKFELREARGAERAEYWLWDARYGFDMQTYVYADASINQDVYEKMYRQQCRRLVFLKDKLISDLEKPEKILVFQHLEGLSDDDIAALLRAIRKYGPGTLLCVRPHDERHSAGTVETIESGLLIGYLDRFFSGTSLPGFDTWLKICLAADQMWERSLSR